MSNEVPGITVPPEVKFGKFANAFRVIEEVGPDCFLDFIVYSGQEKRAEVVSRVRVRKEFLPTVRECLGQAFHEFSGTPLIQPN